MAQELLMNVYNEEQCRQIFVITEDLVQKVNEKVKKNRH